MVNPRENISVLTLRREKELLHKPREVSHGHNESVDLEIESAVPKSDSKSTFTLKSEKALLHKPRELPTKCKYQVMFAIPVKIGTVGVKNTMCDLCTLINIISLSIFQSLNVDLLKEIGVVIQLADRSTVYFDEVLENVLVQVDNLIFPADF
ncbi:uncharacterized protein LOC122724636 [Manihot esculenta]|uniref:uncharacterized protein LOC122724636 n=1 Tax=Manihot esculenta TaxID=3983 RepID=UPI001CC6DCA6|nr:uncharacterized protein LOC122724636 [Manihot esculenta]